MLQNALSRALLLKKGNAVTRDSIKREAFSLINVPFIEVGTNGLSTGQIVDLRGLLGLPKTVAAE